ncbi:MAG TPA: SOS response-associated peptidase [Jatrophihabitantaceae bacterium]|jgi:putative SOS response-associated peptidase YedK|nr:SOS response-associated peptidase [Jatrophihabitantaceae bacterium]
MCGRYVNVASTSDLQAEFDVEETIGEDLPPSWNIAPTDPVRIITRRRSHGGDAEQPVVQLRTVRWGLVPSWSRSRATGAKMINVRSETMATKFRVPAGRRRGLSPSLGYYEWRRVGHGKVPYFLHGADGELLALACLYEIWRDPELPDGHPDRWLWTSAIITRPATDALGHIHDRCPVIVPPDLYEAWLDCGGDPAVARDLLDRIPEPHLQPRVVGSAVGNVGSDGPELIEPAAIDRDRPVR